MRKEARIANDVMNYIYKYIDTNIKYRWVKFGVKY